MFEEKMINKKIKFGKEVLGPIFYEFCAKLRIYINNQDPKNTVVLYESRGGLRLRYLFGLFLEKNNFEIKTPEKDFFISRLAAINGCLSLDPDYVLTILKNKKKDLPLKNIISSFLKEDIEEEDLSGLRDLKDVYLTDRCIGLKLRKHFKEQSEMFRSYFNELTENKENVILVDTGWIASVQGILMRSFKNKNFIGAYFGKWDYNQSYPEYFLSVNGLGVENNKHNFFHNKRGSIFHFHHLVEDVLEPKIQSIEKYDKKRDFLLYFNSFEYNKIILEKENDFLFEGIVLYFNQNKNKSIVEIHRNAEKAYSKLARKIFFPSRKDVLVMTTNTRSHDFGDKGGVEAIVNKPNKLSMKLKKINISRALWKQGQIRVEFGVFAGIFLWAYYFYYQLKHKGKIVL